MYRDNFIYPETKIPEEGLLLYPVAVRAPTGHKLSLIDDVKLKASLLSHDRSEHGDFTPNMFSCHEGLIPGGLDGTTRIFTFFNPYVPWDPRSWNITRSVDTRLGGYMFASTSRPRLS